MNEPAKLDPEIGALLVRITPKFGECVDCGSMTSGRRCYECEGKRDGKVKAVDQVARSIPEAFAWAELDSPLLGERTGVWSSVIVQARMASSAHRVVLFGSSGRGKTSLACAMMREWAKRTGRGAMFLLATELASSPSRAQFGKEPHEVAEAKGADLLVLDDLGTDRDSPSSPIKDVVFYRHSKDRPTWVTTWLGSDAGEKDAKARAQKAADAVSARYGDGFSRRVFGHARIIDCG